MLARTRGRRHGPRLSLALAVLVPLVAFVLSSAVPVRAQRKDDGLAAERSRLAETQRQLREERQKAAEARRRESSVLAELEEIEQRLATKQRQLTKLEARITQLQADLSGLRGEIGKLEGYRSGQEEALARRLTVIYKIHAQGAALPLLLSGEDRALRAGVIRHLGSLAALDARAIGEYRVTTNKLEDRKRREEARHRELATLLVEARRDQAEVDREGARRRVLLTKVREERVYHERMVGELTEAARRLEALVRELQARQRRLAKVPPPRAPGETPGIGFGSLRGKLPWPTDGRIVSAYGPQVNPRFGTRTFRNGVDIEAAGGTEIAAVYAGHVVYAGWFKGYGNLIIVDHGNDYFTLYAHVADMHVKEGEEIRQGQRIGTVGDTGSLAGPRLYFEVRHEGKPEDPVQWLRQRG